MTLKKQLKELTDEYSINEVENAINEIKHEHNYKRAEDWFKEVILKKTETGREEAFPNELFFYYSDGDTVMRFTENFNIFEVDSHIIWDQLEYFALNDKDIPKIIRDNVKKYFNIDVPEPTPEKDLRFSII